MAHCASTVCPINTAIYQLSTCLSAVIQHIQCAAMVAATGKHTQVEPYCAMFSSGAASGHTGASVVVLCAVLHCIIWSVLCHEHVCIELHAHPWLAAFLHAGQSLTDPSSAALGRFLNLAAKPVQVKTLDGKLPRQFSFPHRVCIMQNQNHSGGSLLRAMLVWAPHARLLTGL